MTSQTAYLVLQNGRVFKGKRFGSRASAMGEIVFTTSMTGYLETLSDPSYYGQFVVQTFPTIGNYGVIPEDFESPRPHLKAYIVREHCEYPSNFRCIGTLDHHLQSTGTIGLYDMDTRALTKTIREAGVMNACILDSLDAIDETINALANFSIQGAVNRVTCKARQVFHAEKHKRTVVLWDFGTKDTIQRELLKRGCDVIRVPAQTKAEAILADHPDGIMLSNGPGDPKDNPSIIQEIKAICASNIPIFGICLGHQLLALANGMTSEKMKYGHRGENQPVKDTTTGRVYITSQNHGYALRYQPDSNIDMRFVNVNDGTCEGLSYRTIPAFSVQFHPEACAGPLDTLMLFDEFIERMEEKTCR